MQLVTLFTLTLLAAGVVTGSSNDRGSTARENLESLGWFAGHWRSAEFETFYTSPEGGVMMSVSKGYSDGKLTFTEFEKIHVQGNAVLLSPHIEGQKPVSFTLTDYDPTVKRAIFRNMKHDFPQEIIFEMTESDTLLILLSGEEGGKKMAMRMELGRAQ